MINAVNQAVREKKFDVEQPSRGKPTMLSDAEKAAGDKESLICHFVYSYLYFYISPPDVNKTHVTKIDVKYTDPQSEADLI